MPIESPTAGERPSAPLVVRSDDGARIRSLDSLLDRQHGTRETFRTARNGPVFAVFFDGNAGTGVRIRLEGGYIHTEGQNIDVHLDGVPAPLAKEGRCRIKVDEQYLHYDYF